MGAPPQERANGNRERLALNPPVARTDFNTISLKGATHKISSSVDGMVVTPEQAGALTSRFCFRLSYLASRGLLTRFTPLYFFFN